MEVLITGIACLALGLSAGVVALVFYALRAGNLPPRNGNRDSLPPQRRRQEPENDR